MEKLIAKFWSRVAHAVGIRSLIPRWIKKIGRYLPGWENYLKQVWRLQDPYADKKHVASYPIKVNRTLGIIWEFGHAHKHYIAACIELGVPYKLIDISRPNWIDVIEDSDCDAFLVQPSYFKSIWKQMYDERLKVMTDVLGKIIYPTYDEIWLYESKRRMHYWLIANGIPHPRTWIFYDYDECLRFIDSSALPIVFKSDFGAGASGVKICRERSLLSRLAKRCFKKGITRDVGDKRDRQWGNVILQEYLPGVEEWRIVRIGKSYFGHKKIKQNDFHSGSGQAGWEEPPKDLLDFTREVTERGGFTSMALDIFETSGQRYLVNELQTVFGFRVAYDTQMLVNGKSGRYLYNDSGRTWHFEEGEFSSRGCYKLRVNTLLEMLHTFGE